MELLGFVLPRFLGGMGLLLYGIYLMSKNLQNIAGHRLRTIFSTITNNKFAALAVGIFVTMLFQSSTATTVILVGLANASMVTLKQTLGVILGADIGTTITAQLIAFKVTEISMPIIGIGAVIVFFTKQDKYRQIGQVLIGFGLLFLGLKIMSETMQPLGTSVAFRDLMASVSSYPLMAILLASVCTFLLFSSAASVGIIMVLAMHGMVTLPAAIYLLFGANIGTSYTALLSSLGSSREAQRVACAHFFFKVVGVLLFLPFVTPYAAFLSKIASTPGFQVANAHAIFNIGTALIFLPFLSQFANFLKRILPDRDEVTRDDLKPKYLDEKLISTPFIALGLAAKEINNASDQVFEMIQPLVTILKKNDKNLLQEVNKKEDYLDVICKAVTNYLSKVMRQALSKEEFNRCMCYMHIINDLELIGDVIEKDVVYIANCKMNKQREFSDDGWNEIADMHERLCRIMQITNVALVSSNIDAAIKAINMQLEIVHLERYLRARHFNRLKEGAALSISTSSLHLDLINSFLWISEHIKNICGEITVLERDPDSAPVGHTIDTRASGAWCSEEEQADSKSGVKEKGRDSVSGKITDGATLHTYLSFRKM